MIYNISNDTLYQEASLMKNAGWQCLRNKERWHFHKMICLHGLSFPERVERRKELIKDSFGELDP